jgi:hypothetical protein
MGVPSWSKNDPGAQARPSPMLRGERDAGAVDGEPVPHRAGAKAGIGERVGTPDRDGLGVGQAGRVDDGADDGGHPVGFQLSNRGAGERCGHGSHSAERSGAVA